MTEFEQAHGSYLREWENALATGNTAALEEYLAPGYRGWFARSAQSEVPFDREEAVDGMRASVEQLRGCRFRTERCVLGHRGEDDAVAFYGKLLERDGAVLAAAMILESWRRTDGRWLLEREVTEHGASLEPQS